MSVAPWSWRETAFVGVLACGAVQAVLTWADVGGPPAPPPLSPVATRGLALWRRHNCQACHQLHGFGGFLGPDLTNVASRATANDLAPLLDGGRKQMPAFGFTAREQREVFAFLAAMDASGQSQPTGLRTRAPIPAGEHWRRLLDAAAPRLVRPMPEPARRGLAVVEAQGCGQCHVPLTAGRWRAPDWTVRVAERPRAEWLATIRTGRDAMPAHDLPDADLAALGDLLAWLAAHRALLAEVDAVLCDREPFRLAEVPWFEYR